MMIERFGSISEFSRKLQLYLQEQTDETRDNEERRRKNSDMSLEEMDFLGITRSDDDKEIIGNHNRNNNIKNIENDRKFNRNVDENDTFDDFSDEFVIPGISLNDDNLLAANINQASQRDGNSNRRIYTMPLSKLFSLFHKYVPQKEQFYCYQLF